MKRLLYILIMCTLLIGCDKMPANGDLDGMWQIIEIEHNGVKKNVKEDQLYMCIQLKLFMLGDKEKPRNYLGYFEHKGDSLSFYKFSYPSTNESAADNNLPIEEENKAILEPWGYFSLNEKFYVEKLTKDVLVIRNDSSIIRYIKF